MDGDPRSDVELIEAMNAGEESAFEALYWRHRDWVVSLAWRLTGNEADALDVLQETFTYFAGKFPGFELRANLRTFLYPAVRNLALAHRRRRQRALTGSEEVLSGIADPAAGEPPEGARAELAAVLGGLPEDQREALLMRFVDDMTLAEIAAALGVPVGTVKSRLHRGVEALRGDPRLREYFMD